MMLDMRNGWRENIKKEGGGNKKGGETNLRNINTCKNSNQKAEGVYAMIQIIKLAIRRGVGRRCDRSAVKAVSEGKLP